MYTCQAEKSRFDATHNFVYYTCKNPTNNFYKRIDKFEGHILPVCNKCYFDTLKYKWQKVSKPSTEKEYLIYNKTRILS